MTSAEIRWLDSLQGSGIRPGIARMRAMLRTAGRPDRRVPSIIVAGTNGKGSTSALLASILTEAGLRTGLYTSPHLIRLEERWRIDGVDVSPRILRGAIRALMELAERSGVRPTYFEAVTMLAFLIFDALRCDVSVLEVGMGGRLDATNVGRPIASLITPISLDHVAYLGSTITAIAREKAGVIHRGTIVLTSNSSAEVLRVIAKRVERVGAIGPIVTSEEARATGPRLAGPRSRFRLTTSSGSYAIDVSLPGAHQVANVALAVRAAEELRGRFPAIDRRAIVTGVRNAVWRGRLERFVLDGREVWVDGAHNPGGAETVARFVESHLGRPRALVLGMLSDKDVAGVASILVPRFDAIIVTQPRSERAMPVGGLRKVVAAAGQRAVRSRRRVRDAIRLVLDSGGRGPVVVCGSLYVAGEAVRTLERMSADERGCGSSNQGQ